METIADENVNGATSVENNMVNPQKINRITIGSSTLTSGYIPKRIESRDLNTYLCIQYSQQQ